LRRAVDKTDLQRVFAVKIFDHANLALFQLNHQRQTPAVDGVLRGVQKLERKPGFARQQGEGGSSVCR
jgi:hypothetical protein